MNTAILITTYCDTDEKLRVLNNCIDHIKTLYNGELDILLYNHYPISLDIQKKVNYSIYDSTNPVINSYDEKYGVLWYNITGFIGTPTHAVTTMRDTGYAVLSMWQKGCSYLKSHGYKNVCIITYDSCVFGDEFKNYIDNGIEVLKESEAFMETYINGYTQKVENAYTMNYAMFDIEAFINKISPKINRDYYLSIYEGAEEMIYRMISESGMTVKLDNTLDDKNLISGCKHRDIGIKSISMFWFGRDYDDKPTIVIYENDSPIVEATFEVNDKTSFDIKSDAKYLVFQLPVKWSDIQYIKVVRYCGKYVNKIAFGKPTDDFILHNFFDRQN